MRNQRGPGFLWGVSLAGLVIGLVGGLVYAWFVNPVEFVNIAPDRLSAEDQREYVLLVAESYMQSQDIDRAQQRLAALGVRDIGQMVAVQADSALLRGGNPDEVRALATLAEALGAHPLAADVFSGTVAPTTVVQLATPTDAPTPTVSVTLAPSATPNRPTPTLAVVGETELELVEREDTCEDEGLVGLLEVSVRNRFDQGIPAVEVQVEWEDGQDRFFTGLKPDIDPGYADFQMVADRTYVVTLVGLSEPVVGLSSAGCLTPRGRTSIPSFRLIFAPAGE
jgi:hypothetical protein